MLSERIHLQQYIYDKNYHIILKYKWKCQIGSCLYMCRTYKEMRFINATIPKRLQQEDALVHSLTITLENKFIRYLIEG